MRMGLRQSFGATFKYYVYRVYDCDQTSHVGKLYVRRGAIEAAFRRTAMPYRVMPTSVITLASQLD